MRRPASLAHRFIQYSGAITDLMIGVSAIVHGVTLVTHNVKDFVNIPGLQIEDWLKPKH